MQNYRVYCLDGASKFVTAEVIFAENDEEAVMLARKLETGLRREIWDRNRHVSTIEIDPGPGPAETDPV
ncbi:hypothetical protein ACUXST_001531 [Sphingomonas sp. F9_3S_D5_B_2]